MDSHAPDNQEIRRQLARIVGSAVFRDLLRLTRFLRFVVELTLAGDSARIKAYTIALGALGRGSNFDPQTDPIVRVEAGRLRHALTRYYADTGRNDPVAIDMPRGTYVPVFRRSDAESQEPPAPSKIDQLPAVGVASHWSDPLGRRRESERLRETVQLQFIELHAQMLITRDTLQDSRVLLRQQSDTDVARDPALPLMPTEPPVSHDAEPPADAEPVAVPAFRQQLEQSRTGWIKSGVRALKDAAMDCVRRHRRIFKCVVFAVCVLAVLEVVFDIDRPLHGGPSHGLFFKWFAAADGMAGQWTHGEAAPVIYVEPPTLLGQPTATAISATAIHDRMIDVLARFDDVTVVGSPPPAGSTGAFPRSASESGAAPPSHYRVATTAQYDQGNAITMTVRLVDTADGTTAWSKTYQSNSNPDANWESEFVAGDFGRSLLQPFGVVEARERTKRAAASNLQDTYRCILDANANLRNFDPSQYPSVENCLVHATSEQPPAVSVFVALARLYLRNYRFGIVGQPGDRAMLDRASQMARRAIELKPNSALAEYALQDVLLAQGDLARAKAAGDASLRLNPYDGSVIFGHAYLLIMLGQLDEGIALLRENSARTATTWIGYHLVLGLASYLKGDLKAATIDTSQIASPYLPPGLVLDALVASKSGDPLRAHQDIATLYRAHPSWRENFRANVALFLPDPVMVDRITTDFAAAAADMTQ